MTVSTGVPSSRGQWTKKYSDGANLHYATFVEYKTGQGGRGLNPTLDSTYLLYERNRGLATEWVTAAKLSVDGKLIPLKESEAFRVTGENYNQLERIGGTSNENILGDLAIQDLNAGGTGSLRYQTINNAKYLLSKDSGVSSEEVNRAYDISNNIKPPGSPGTPGLLGPPVAADQPTAPSPGAPGRSPGANDTDYTNVGAEFGKDVSGGTRKNYNGTGTNLRYPENLQLEQQDCIKFTIFEYNPRGLGLESDPNRRLLNKKQEKDKIGTIFLPIPGGISDSNNADWQKDDLDVAAQGFSDLIVKGVAGGTDAAAASAKKTFEVLDAAGKETLTSIVAVKTAQSVLGANVFSRAYGQVLNPNSELLFNGPSLRTFSFTFRLSPRSSSEAKIVKTIIRYFKQAMSVQRSQSILLLKAPNTFGIEYLTAGKNKSHPYLNKFKECALTQCNVNYTPDGQYMTYASEPSMTSYEMQLQFQELEPIFNDDYTDADGGQADSNIGY
jgi:hypothetical protein